MATLAEYLEIERAAETRSEYFRGDIVAMAGASRNHGWIASETLVRLGEQLRGRTCGATGIDTLLYLAKYDVAAHPDVVVTCGPDVFLDEKKDAIADATLVVEVLSPSTRDHDKFFYYRGLPSFAEYLLLAQDAIRAEHHVRQPDGSWLFREIAEPTAVIELSSIGCRLPLGALYERVQFEKPA
jgi:Uma2 family endonuclease